MFDKLRGSQGRLRFIISEPIRRDMTDEERLAEGYQKYAERHRNLINTLEGVSTEATERLGESPTWADDTEE
jgi:hypothetical protein